MSVKFDSVDLFPLIELTLPNPILGDSFYVNQDRKINRNRFDEPLIINSLVVAEEHFILTFVAVDLTTIVLTKNFVKLTAGVRIDFTDHRGKIWRGIITSPDLKIVQQGRSDYFNFVIEFEGVPKP